MMKWWDDAACKGINLDWFFDDYENDPNIRPQVDKMCMNCPVQRVCFSTGISNEEYGVWGGVYLTSGRVDATMNDHKSSDDWLELWESLTMDENVLH